MSEVNAMTESTDLMDPEASPGEITKSGVRRVNNLPVYIFLTVVILFLLVIALVAADRAEQQNSHPDETKNKTGSTTMFAKEIAGDRMDGIVEAATKPVVPDMPIVTEQPVLIAKPNLDVPPAPPSGGSINEPARDEEAIRIRMAKLQMLEEAVKSKTSVQVIAPRSASSASEATITTSSPKTRYEVLARLAAVRQKINEEGGDDPTRAYQAHLARVTRLRSMGLDDGRTDSSNEIDSSETDSSAAPQLLQTAANERNSIDQFAGSVGSDRWRLDSKTEAPRTPYELRAGFVLPATLISGINSELPGQIMAQVAQNVYDTPTGKHLLIPQGSRLVGAYSSDVAYGQGRVLVAWQRIVFPDGKALDIGAMPGADGAGYAGFNDLENHHYVRLFGSALLMSAVTGAISYSQRQDQGTFFGRQDAGTALSEALGQQLGQVTAQLIAKNMNIAPTLEIRPGYRFNVIVTKDMTFTKPYQSFDY
jgi:type IV secretory pathway VirB10-like protein